MSLIHQVWPEPSCKAQLKWVKNKEDRKRGGKTTSTSRYGQAWSSPGPRGQWRKETGCEVICGAPEMLELKVKVIIANVIPWVNQKSMFIISCPLIPWQNTATTLKSHLPPDDFPPTSDITIPLTTHKKGESSKSISQWGSTIFLLLHFRPTMSVDAYSNTRLAKWLDFYWHKWCSHT